MNLLKSFIAIIDRISRMCGALAGIMLLIGLMLITGEIIVRSLFERTLYITEEYSGYLMVGITFLGLSYTLKEKGHIRMSFLPTVLKGKGRHLLDLYAYLLGFLFCLVAIVATFDLFWDSVLTQSRSMQLSATYLAIPQFLMPLGLTVMAFQFMAETGRVLLKLISGKDEENERLESKALGR